MALTIMNGVSSACDASIDAKNVFGENRKPDFTWNDCIVELQNFMPKRKTRRQFSTELYAIYLS